MAPVERAEVVGGQAVAAFDVGASVASSTGAGSGRTPSARLDGAEIRSRRIERDPS